MKIRFITVLALLTGTTGLSGEDASDGAYQPRIGPDQTENQMTLDRRTQPLYESQFLKGIADSRDSFAAESGFSWSMDYTSMWQGVSESLGADSASAGMVRLFGSWDLFNRGETEKGSLIWKVEHRHSYTDTPVSGLGFESGYVGLFEPPFSDQGSRLTNLYWKQTTDGGRGTFVAGFLDITDFYDVYLLASPWTGFNNFVFSTGSATTDLPAEAALGLAYGLMLGEEFYAQAGVVDADSDPTDPFSSILENKNFYSYVEFGWTPSSNDIYFQNAHVSLWQVDKRTNGTPGGWGVNLSYQTWIDDKWLPFIRGGYTEDSGSLLRKSVSMGLGYQPVPNRGVFGAAINWGEPNPVSFGSTRDQITFEGFWRANLTKDIAVTPSIQFIESPALNTAVDNMWAFGLRVRVVL